MSWTCSAGTECSFELTHRKQRVDVFEKKMFKIEMNLENIKITLSGSHNGIIDVDDNLKKLAKQILNCRDKVDSELEEMRMNEDYDFQNIEVKCIQEKFTSLERKATELLSEYDAVYADYMQILVLSVIKKINELMFRDKRQVLLLEKELQKRQGLSKGSTGFLESSFKKDEGEFLAHQVSRPKAEVNDLFSEQEATGTGVFSTETMVMISVNQRFMNKVHRLGNQVQKGNSCTQDTVNKLVEMFSKDSVVGDKSTLCNIFNSYVLQYQKIGMHYNSLISKYELDAPIFHAHQIKQLSVG